MPVVKARNPDALALWAHGTIVRGVHFTHGEDAEQVWYETQQGNSFYHLFQHKKAVVKAWFIVVTQVEGDRITTLNTAVYKLGGKEIDHADPLYVKEELPLCEWLRLLGKYIQDGHSPWEDS